MNNDKEYGEKIKGQRANDVIAEEFMSMSRDIEELVVFYGMGGKVVDSEPRALAKVITKNSKEYFFIWFWRGDLYDPYGPDILRKSQQFMSKFMKVNKDVFDNYHKYLKTKNRIYLTRAKRMSLI